ncbi:GTPase-activating protein gyp1 [Porphyridium purpureum]|uniref:GTPase-activating protein gyp1 n=1 Tax=Porphyridium purpureum TaxID=35688 RepID=A0A5J4YKJ1_PORPP|nr:GTPase-activating protein gyp1 [Porphyridium purpureum]|eukprot:POR6268..scf291_13
MGMESILSFGRAVRLNEEECDWDELDRTAALLHARLAFTRAVLRHDLGVRRQAEDSVSGAAAGLESNDDAARGESRPERNDENVQLHADVHSALSGWWAALDHAKPLPLKEILLHYDAIERDRQAQHRTGAGVRTPRRGEPVLHRALSLEPELVHETRASHLDQGAEPPRAQARPGTGAATSPLRPVSNFSVAEPLSVVEPSGAAPLAAVASVPIVGKKQSVLLIEDRISKRNPGESMLNAYEKVLSAPTVDLEALRKLAWHGIPLKYRATVWKLLLEYVPASASRRPDVVQRKRREYQLAVEQHFGGSHAHTRRAQGILTPKAPAARDLDVGGAAHDRSINGRPKAEPLSPMRDISNSVASEQPNPRGSQAGLSEYEQSMHRQIGLDIPRTCPGQALFHIESVQASLERVLYVWAMRHPASGYVQGMNDLLTPFLFVFFAEQSSVLESGEEVLCWTNLQHLSAKGLADAEADAYWCLTALLESIHDYYIFAQPGIQKRVLMLQELVSRVRPDVHAHLLSEGLDFIQFAFRWMNCLLMRELPFVLIVRIWDTYLCERDGFGVFHVYVCAALLSFFHEELLCKDFQDLVLFLQNLPTKSWTQTELDMILSQAFMWRSLFDSSVHLRGD